MSDLEVSLFTKVDFNTVLVSIFVCHFPGSFEYDSWKIGVLIYWCPQYKIYSMLIICRVKTVNGWNHSERNFATVN